MYNTGNNIVSNGDVVKVAEGTYQCDEIGSNCAFSYADYGKMFCLDELSISIECANDSADCVLDGQSSRRVIQVVGTGGIGQKVTLRALNIRRGAYPYSSGGGATFHSGAIVDIILCIFSNCRSIGSSSSSRGGALYIYDSIINVYGSRFSGNTADSGNGGDISGGKTITIHNTCPSPYSSISPTQGKTKLMRMDCITLLIIPPTNSKSSYFPFIISSPRLRFGHIR